MKKGYFTAAAVALTFCAAPLVGCNEKLSANQQNTANTVKTTVSETEWHDAFLLENLSNCYGTFDHYQMIIASDDDDNPYGYYTRGIEFMGTMQMGVNGMSFLSDCFIAIPNQAEKYDNGEYNIIIIENENMYDLYLEDSKGGWEKWIKYSSKEFTKEQYNDFLDWNFKDHTMFDVLCNHYNDFTYDSVKKEYSLISSFTVNRTMESSSRNPRMDKLTFNTGSVSFKDGKIDVITINVSVVWEMSGFITHYKDIEYSFNFETYGEQTIEIPVLDDK